MSCKEASALSLFWDSEGRDVTVQIRRVNAVAPSRQCCCSLPLIRLECAEVERQAGVAMTTCGETHLVSVA